GTITWRNDWEMLPEYPVKQEDSSLPAPAHIFYDHTDRKLKPFWYYRYRVRAVGRNRVPGQWSSPIQIQLTDDNTAPDQPTITVENFTGVNKITISEPAINGGPCPDFSHFVIEGYEQSAGTWVTLDPHYTDTVFYHAVDDADLEKNWKYRVTAYDHSGNVSVPSAESSYKKQKKASTAFLSSGVNNTLAQVSVNEANIQLKVDKGGVINAINISTEGIDIEGDNLNIDADTVFQSTAEIYGYLKLVKTDEGGDRIEIGVFNGTPMIKLFQDGVLGLRIQAEDISGDSVGTMRLYGPDVMEIGETYQCVLTGWGIYFGSDATAGWATALQLPDASKFGCSYIPEPLIGWDLTNNKLKVKAGGTIYTFSPD
ncbi:MAG: hypothetical protein DRP79_07400, partial [Planctomycetota bacterium]